MTSSRTRGTRRRRMRTGATSFGGWGKARTSEGSRDAPAQASGAHRLQEQASCPEVSPPPGASLPAHVLERGDEDGGDEPGRRVDVDRLAGDRREADLDR